MHKPHQWHSATLFLPKSPPFSATNILAIYLAKTAFASHPTSFSFPESWGRLFIYLERRYILLFLSTSETSSIALHRMGHHWCFGESLTAKYPGPLRLHPSFCADHLSFPRTAPFSLMALPHHSLTSAASACFPLWTPSRVVMLGREAFPGVCSAPPSQKPDFGLGVPFTPAAAGYSTSTAHIR